MSWSAAQRYTSERRAAGDARRFCSRHIADILGTGPAAATVAADAEVIVSELVTNSIQAGSTRVDVRLALRRDHLLLTVADDAPGRPQRRTPLPTDARGRGLAIIAALARAWGTAPSGAGKEVWAHLAVLPELTADLDYT
jgi:two-component sensor histidine kinase